MTVAVTKYRRRQEIRQRVLSAVACNTESLFSTEFLSSRFAEGVDYDLAHAELEKIVNDLERKAARMRERIGPWKEQA